ncbi:hypothetical protein RGQ29_007314 [Quercus rubra]|uniref:Uncharacterized protein n=1 Tax=Quercus rubra TaxID=3512 RepID=A0AAN7DXW8_QUERU|nr:hypothetical protein RGQ29_007314 [Quercus rubra]
MACLDLSKGGKFKEDQDACTLDGTVDMHGRPAIRTKSGRWVAGIIILLNQGLATLAFFGVGVNLVLFLTRVVGENNADAANSVSKWTGTIDTKLVPYFFVIGLVSLSLSSYLFLLKPRGCGDELTPCGAHSSMENLSIYLVALGNGGYQPNIEGHSKVSFFSYFYLALNLGELISNIILIYFEDEGMWALGFWVSAGSAFAALVFFLVGTRRYRHFKPSGNPLSRFSQVIVAAVKKWRVEVPSNAKDLYTVAGNESSTNGNRRILHTHGFKFLDKVAFISSRDFVDQNQCIRNPWRLCPITLEEVKCILRLLPIWLCTTIYSVVFTQMASLFVEQGAVMKTTISHFRIPPASMSSFDILSVALFILLYRRILDPLVGRIKKSNSTGLIELQRMGIGLVIAIMAIKNTERLYSGTVECYRLKYAIKDCTACDGSSSLSIFWQIPQYAFIGVSEVFMYVGQLEFFNAQTPDGLKSFGSALCLTSISLGNYVSSLLVSIVMKISTEDHMPGWIPGNLNKGHLDRFFFLLAALTTVDLVVYIGSAKWYKCIKLEGKFEEADEEDDIKV